MAIRNAKVAGWLVDSLRSGLVAIDASGELLALNPAAQRILGVPEGSPRSWLGRDFREALAGCPQVVALLEAALDGRERPSRAEVVLRRGGADGVVTLGFTVLPLLDESAALRGAAIQFRDLSAFERGDEQARLRDRLAALGEMAAGLAHELRNPLAGMEMMAGLLERRLPPDGDERALLLDLRAQLRSIAGTLDRTLEFVRPVAPEPQAVDAAALVDLALERACSRVPFPGKVERSVAPDLPRVCGDPEQLLAVLTDLAVNALEAMADAEATAEPRLQVDVRAEARPEPQSSLRISGPLPVGAEPGVRGEVVVTLRDSGPGVPAELRERIFYPFFTTKDAGSGVGLAKAQKVVASHGGCLELGDEPGPGAVFHVRLPAAEPSR